MFTGIIEELGRVATLKKNSGSIMFTYKAELARELTVDDSVSVNGVCQTVVWQHENEFSTVVIEETLRKTNFGDLRSGHLVNLERSVSLQTRLDGHMVQGHTDTTGEITEINSEGTNWLISIRFPLEFAAYIVGRGSIAVDGVSLTVAQLQTNSFTIAIIPYTWDHTNFHTFKKGDKVNIEFDIIGKYILRHLEINQQK